MKFDTLAQEATSVGGIKGNNVSIDNSNINFIVTILSTNLYSKPIQSFIRETVSNAWDSHIEAGITEPVLLELGKDSEGNYFCRIQDFGVGLSPERFDTVYRNIGSSTKRSDNTQIGGFGIGRFSALAYSDVVHVTSNYDGTKYKYIMYKDGNSISIDLLHEQPTTDRNGVEVQVELKDYRDVDNFYSAIKEQLVYFENLYFVDNTGTNGDRNQEEFNNFHIKKYNNFLVNDLDSSSNIDLVLGKVRYPLRISNLSKGYSHYIEEYPISLIFNIGDLEVTPNREEILYSNKNIEKIQTVLDEALLELDEFFKLHTEKDFTVISEYIEALKNSQKAPLMEIDGEERVMIKINSGESKITFNGIAYKKKHFEEMYNHIMASVIVPISYQLSNGKLNYINYNYSLNAVKSSFSKIYIGDVAELANISKTYIRETLENGSLFIHTNRDVRFFYKKLVKKIEDYCSGHYNNLHFDIDIIKVIIKSIAPNILNIRKFNDRSVPITYIEAKKAEDKARRALRKGAGIDWSENVNINELRLAERGNSNISTTSVTYKLDMLKKKYRKITVFADKGDIKLKTFYSLLLNKTSTEIDFIEVAPTRQKLLSNFDNFVNLEKFMNTDYKIIRQIGTAKLIEEKIPHIHDLYKNKSSLAKISTKLYNAVDELSSYCKGYLNNKTNKLEGNLIDEIYELCQKENYFDIEMEATLNINLDMLVKAESLLLFVDKGSYSGGIPDNRINLAVDYILARKLFRPDVSSVVKLKKETILNIKEDEDIKA